MIFHREISLCLDYLALLFKKHEWQSTKTKNSKAFIKQILQEYSSPKWFKLLFKIIFLNARGDRIVHYVSFFLFYLLSGEEGEEGEGDDWASPVSFSLLFFDPLKAKIVIWNFLTFSE